MGAWLHFLGTYIPLEPDESYLIGRGPGCEIHLPDISVSRRHARVEPEDGGFAIEDLGSTNGTHVNGRQIRRKALEAGDRIRVGRLHLEYQVRDEEHSGRTLPPGDTIALEGEIARLVREVNDPDLAKRISGLGRFVSRSKRRLSELAFHDHLTGLYNRRSLDARLREEVERVHRYERPFTLLLADIDHFKDCNDRFGHQRGDEVLRSVARLILTNVRRSDFVARYGGEEMAVVLPETAREEGGQVAEKIRSAIAEHSETYAGVAVTVSIGGVCCWDTGCEGEELLREADRALYEAKETGRNQVVMH